MDSRVHRLSERRRALREAALEIDTLEPLHGQVLIRAAPSAMSHVTGNARMAKAREAFGIADEARGLARAEVAKDLERDRPPAACAIESAINRAHGATLDLRCDLEAVVDEVSCAQDAHGRSMVTQRARVQTPCWLGSREWRV